MEETIKTEVTAEVKAEVVKAKPKTNKTVEPIVDAKTEAKNAILVKLETIRDNMTFAEAIEHCFEVPYTKEIRDKLYSSMWLIWDKFWLPGSKVRNVLALDRLKNMAPVDFNRINVVVKWLTK